MSNTLVSTRDVDSHEVGYTEALLGGLAPDGGLYVPSNLTGFSRDGLRVLMANNYPELAAHIKSTFTQSPLGVFIFGVVALGAFGKDNYPDSVDGNVVPIRQISEEVYVQNLSLGPTAAFKDMALQPVAREMDKALEQSGGVLRILGATSGDTGSAAEAAFKGRENIRMFMLSPLVGMTVFQRAQMAELSGGNIVNISVEGNFDDCQDIVKAVNSDPEFADLGAVNSINWGRIASQIPYYFSGYGQIPEAYAGREVDFAVPSGNFGNALSGYYARRMGLPIGNIVIATNENSVLHQLVQTGLYRKSPAQITSSPSMDISKASNFERLAFDIFSQDPEKLQAYMKAFETNGEVSFDDFGAANTILLEMGFRSVSSTHQNRLKTIQSVYSRTGSVIDPHTADGVRAGEGLKRAGIPIICLETALPVKFEPTIREALDFTPERPVRFRGIEDKMTGGEFIVVKPDVAVIKGIIRAHS